ncbi:hypothetical protein ABIB40_003807 [Pedobacter sp. UYP30]
MLAIIMIAGCTIEIMCKAMSDKLIKCLPVEQFFYGAAHQNIRRKLHKRRAKVQGTEILQLFPIHEQIILRCAEPHTQLQ